jgi:hypothetical protein
VSAQPVEPDDGQEDGPEREPALSAAPALSALDDAVRAALGTVAREQVLYRVAMALRIEVDPDGLHGRTRDDQMQQDKVQKVSVSMPAGLAALVRARAGAGGFSKYVTEAVQEQIRLDLLADLSAELESEYGPIDKELVEQAMREWPDFAEE